MTRPGGEPELWLPPPLSASAGGGAWGVRPGPWAVGWGPPPGLPSVISRQPTPQYVLDAKCFKPAASALIATLPEVLLWKGHRR